MGKAEKIEPEWEQQYLGRGATIRYQITPEHFKVFANLFGDRNPVHVDVPYAKSLGFPDLVMHGAILNGFISNFVGNVLPGPGALELAVEIRFLNPCYLNDEIELKGEIIQVVPDYRTVVLRLDFRNLTRKDSAAAGKVTVKIL